jgi:hypothetical protein
VAARLDLPLRASWTSLGAARDGITIDYNFKFEEAIHMQTSIEHLIDKKLPGNPLSGKEFIEAVPARLEVARWQKPETHRDFADVPSAKILGGSLPSRVAKITAGGASAIR